MSQIILRANLMAGDFPLCSRFQGNTVLFGQYDQKSPQASGAAIGTGKDNDEVPEAYYMHNVLPTVHGYKSVAYQTIINPPISGGIRFTRIIAMRDSDEPKDKDRGYIGITADARTFLISTLNTQWVDITPAGQPICDVTVATVAGMTYIFYANWGMFWVDMDINVLIPMTLTGLTTAITNIVGITSSNNYLILHDGFSIYWSNPLSATDFTPSLITGAGSEIPSTVGGLIKAIYPLSTGFAIYSTSNIVLSLYTGNTRYPWIFKEANNSAGIDVLTDVAPAGDNGTNYAWTSGGLLQVSLQGCTPVYPAATDFLSGAIFEDYDPLTKALNTQYLTKPLKVQLLFSSARLLVISYGISSLTHCIVYDTVLKRAGKLKIPHVTAFDFMMDYSGSGVPWKDKTLFNWNSGNNATTGWNQVKRLSADAAIPRHTLAFVQEDGSIKLAMLDYGNFTADAVLILGKYQLTRTQLITVQEVDVETIDPENSNFKLSLISTVRIFGELVTSTTSLYTPSMYSRIYPARVTGITHSLRVEGSFNLVSVTFRFSKAGRR